MSSVFGKRVAGVQLYQKTALWAVSAMRWGFDTATGYPNKLDECRWLRRIVFLETVAGDVHQLAFPSPAVRAELTGWQTSRSSLLGSNKRSHQKERLLVSDISSSHVGTRLLAGVPGMVGGMLRHMKSLRSMSRDHGWIHTLLEEAENGRA